MEHWRKDLNETGYNNCVIQFRKCKENVKKM